MGKKGKRDLDGQFEFKLCPFTVIIDTREQAPFHFRTLKADADSGRVPLVVEVERKGIPTGDYSIVGHESSIAIERKSLPDLLHCCGQDRDRFQKQLDRLNELQVAALVVEADWTALLKGHPMSKISPKTVYRSIIAWQQRLPNIHWWLCPGRAFAETTTFRILERFHRDLHDGKRRLEAT